MKETFLMLLIGAIGLSHAPTVEARIRSEEIIIRGTHRCAGGNYWDGWSCSPYSGGLPTPRGRVDLDLPREPRGRGSGTGGIRLPKNSKACKKCVTKYNSCIALANVIAEEIRKLHREEAHQLCNLNDGDPLSAEAKGGIQISDLVTDKIRIPPFIPQDWEFSCGNKVVKGEKKYVCEGPAYTNCMKSYRMDLPGGDFGEEATLTLSLKDLGFSVAGKQSVAYKYGGKTGWASASNSVAFQLKNACLKQKSSCLSKNRCIATR